jgi:hypothetical protein
VLMARCLANGGASTNLGLKALWVQEKGGRTNHQSVLGRPAWADWPRPILARFGRPYAPVGPHVLMHFAPFHLHYFDGVILASKMEVLLA